MSSSTLNDLLSGKRATLPRLTLTLFVSLPSSQDWIMLAMLREPALLMLPEDKVTTSSSLTSLSLKLSSSFRDMLLIA